MVGSLGGLLPMQFSITFSAVRRDGTVVTWGNSMYAGDSSGVQDQLFGVQCIQTLVRNRAF